MSAEDRALDVRTETVGSTVVLTAAGEIDMASAPDLQSAVEEALRAEPPVLVVDLTGVGFFGSAGLSVLLVAAEAAPERSLRVVASEPVRRPIEITGLDRVLLVFATRDDALASEEVRPSE